jgi:hypothetical protein
LGGPWPWPAPRRRFDLGVGREFSGPGRGDGVRWA